MKEMELKILDVDRKSVENKLIYLGASKIFDDIIYTLFFDDKNGSIKKEKNLLRLRSYGKTHFLTYKKYLEDAEVKTMEEYEIEISDIKSMASILHELGFYEDFSVKKHRTSYRLKDTLFEFDKYLDEYDYIPEFLEIEVKQSESFQFYINKLNLEDYMIIPWSFFDIATYYQEKL